MLTAAFAQRSLGARRLLRAGHCRLRFSACAQGFTLDCRIWRLAHSNPHWQSTFWHNQLFNPGAPGDLLILGFEPDWASSEAEPDWP